MEENPEIPQILVENSVNPICDDDKTEETIEQVMDQLTVNDLPKEVTAATETIEKSEIVSEQINLSFEDSEDSENVQLGTCILKKLEDCENSVISLKDELAKKENMVMEITKEKSMVILRYKIYMLKASVKSVKYNLILAQTRNRNRSHEVCYG